MEMVNAEPALPADGKNRALDLKRKRAARFAAYFIGARRGKVARTSAKEQASNRCCHSRGCCCEKSVINNYTNFSKSGLPQRLMFSSCGDWNDFPANVTVSLIEAFRARKSATEILMQGCPYLVDFRYMLLVNLKTGLHQSVAWIDESKRCFFPTSFFDSDDMHDCLNWDLGRNGSHTKMGLNSMGGIDVKLEIEVSGTDSSKPKDSSGLSISHIKNLKVQQHLPSNKERCELGEDSDADRNRCAEIKEVIAENDVSVPSGRGLKSQFHPSHHITVESFGFESLGDKLVRLERGNHDYLAMQNIFLTGLGTFLTTSNIVGIYRYLPTSSCAKARLQSFQKQIEITKRYRGDANVRRAWHGSSREGILRIMLHGFGRVGKPPTGESYGTGIYLAPEDSSHVSANYSDVDENGVQHMVLCRIILGNMEQVQPGSEMFHPSCENFDSGVDDIRCPKHYIIWSTHMNTHIHPEYVVSFKVPSNVRENLTSQSTIDAVAVTDPSMHKCQLKRPISTSILVRDGKLFVPSCVGHLEKIHSNAPGAVKMPTSAWMPFPVLFAAIEKNISPLKKVAVDHHYNDFQMKKITREEFIRKLRCIVGDKLLRSTLESLQSNICQRSPRKRLKESSFKQIFTMWQAILVMFRFLN